MSSCKMPTLPFWICKTVGPTCLVPQEASVGCTWRSLGVLFTRSAQYWIKLNHMVTFNVQLHRTPTFARVLQQVLGITLKERTAHLFGRLRSMTVVLFRQSEGTSSPEIRQGVSWSVVVNHFQLRKKGRPWGASSFFGAWKNDPKPWSHLGQLTYSLCSRSFRQHLGHLNDGEKGKRPKWKWDSTCKKVSSKKVISKGEKKSKKNDDSTKNHPKIAPSQDLQLIVQIHLRPWFLHLKSWIRHTLAKKLAASRCFSFYGLWRNSDTNCHCLFILHLMSHLLKKSVTARSAPCLERDTWAAQRTAWNAALRYNALWRKMFYKLETGWCKIPIQGVFSEALENQNPNPRSFQWSLIKSEPQSKECSVKRSKIKIPIQGVFSEAW